MSMLKRLGGREEASERRRDLGAYLRTGDDRADHGQRGVDVPAGPGEADRYPGGLQGAERGREVVRQLLQDHYDLREVREEQQAREHRAPGGVARTRLETGHGRLLATLFGGYGGLLQRTSIITGFAWLTTVSARAIHRPPAGTARRPAALFRATP